MSNNRLQMLLRVKLAASDGTDQSIDSIVQELSEGLCASEFLYDAVTELRHDDQLIITAVKNAKIARLTEKGKRVLEFDTKIHNKIAAIIDQFVFDCNDADVTAATDG